MQILEFTEIPSLRDQQIVGIYAGLEHSLFLDDLGALWTCGKNKHGQLGNGPFKKWVDIPIQIEYFVSQKIKIKEVACGCAHNLVVSEENVIYSWGKNKSGQCGHGTDKSSYSYPKEIVCFKKMMGVNMASEVEIEIQCGINHSYVRSMDGQRWLFGSNEYNECLLYNYGIAVREPYCIDKLLRKTCDLNETRVIKMISLGVYNTKIIVGPP